MIKALRWIFSSVKFWGNEISFNSTVTLNCKLGKKNSFSNSYIIGSRIGHESKFNNSLISNSLLGDQISCGTNSKCFSVTIDSNVSLGNDILATNAVIGKYTYLAGRNRVFNTDIGKFCSIAENVMIGHAEHPSNYISTSPLFYKSGNEFNTSEYVVKEYSEFSKTTIGNDVWIGANAFIKTGIIIGNGAIIGAGAVVTKNVAPYTIVGGVPAKLIRKRFSNAIIAQLQKMQWWELGKTELKKAACLFHGEINEEILLAFLENTM